MILSVVVERVSGGYTIKIGTSASEPNNSYRTPSPLHEDDVRPTPEGTWPSPTRFPALRRYPASEGASLSPSRVNVLVFPC